MKKLVYLLLPIALEACQSLQQPPVATGAEAAARPSPDAEPPALPVWHGNVVRASAPSQPILDTLEVSRFFQRYDLTPILQTATGSKQDYALNGFRGAEKYRTEAVVGQTLRNAHRPAAYAITGLSRTRKRITPFGGQLVFEKVSQEPLLTAADKENILNLSMFTPPVIPGSEPVARYALSGRVVLQEAGGQLPSNTFTGSVVLEVALTADGQLVLNSPFLHGPSQGGGLKFEGNWAASPLSPPEPTVWVADIIGYSPHIFQDLAVGEREVNFNPKYAKLGWNSYWENDEWWATSPKPKLSL